MLNDGILQFGAFLWRAPSPINFTSIILKMIGGDPEIQSNIKSNVNALIKTIFELKESWIKFVSAAIKILNKWALILIRDGSKITSMIRNVYDDKGLNSRNPNGANYINITSEIQAYQQMIQVDLNDWSCINYIVNIHIQNSNLTPHLFYKFINESLSSAARKKLSLESALTDTHLIQKLNVQMNSLTLDYKDTTWLNEIIPSFNYQKYLSDMNDLQKFKNPYSQRRNHNNYPNSSSTLFTPNNTTNYELKSRKLKDKQQKKVRTDEIIQWGKDVKTKLKPQFQKDFDVTKFCAYYHRQASKCKQNDNSEECLFGRMARSHKCICKGKHRIYECTTIWK